MKPSQFLLLLLCCSFYTCAPAQKVPEKKMQPEETEVWQPEPQPVTPGYTNNQAPSDAIVLFDGKDLSHFTNAKGDKAEWTVTEGLITVKPGTGAIKTKQGFGDVQLHLEWKTPVDTTGLVGQQRGNSGVFLMEQYEVQILDSYKNRTYSNGQAASVYKQHIPLVNACKAPGEWQTYDIIFTAPRFDEKGTLKTPAYFTVIQNGILVQNHVELIGPTEYIGIPKYKAHADKMSIVLQDHGNYISYRNIWVREL